MKSFVLEQYAIMLVKLALALIVWPIYLLICVFWVVVELWLWITDAK